MSVTINVEIKKQRDDKYKSVLILTNGTSADIADWTLTCKTSATIEDMRRCTIVATDGVYNIIADEKNVLKANDTLELKFDGKGQSPVASDFTFGGAPAPPTPPTPDPTPIPVDPTKPPVVPPGAKALFNLPMVGQEIKDLTAQNIKFQWSYDKQNGYSAENPNPAYFKIVDQGLKMTLYKTDKPFEQKSNTMPRTELRCPTNIRDSVAYVLEFDEFMDVAPTYDFCLFQLFSEALGPNVMVRWRSGQFQLGVIQGDKIFKPFEGKPADLAGKWTRWRLEFALSSKGYLHLFKDGVAVCSLDNHDCAGKASYVKLGMYAQQMQPSNDVSAILKNFHLYSV